MAHRDSASGDKQRGGENARPWNRRTVRLGGGGGGEEYQEGVGETLPKPIPPTPIHGEDVQRERGEVSA